MLLFAKQNAPFVGVTTRDPTKRDDDLLPRLGFRSFPTFAFFNAEGTVVASHARICEVEDFVNMAALADTYTDLETRAAKGDKRAQLNFALLQAEMKQINSDKLKERIESLGIKLDDKQKHRYRTLLAEGMVRKMFEIDVGRAFWEMYRKKLIPNQEYERKLFWEHIGRYASLAPDWRAYEAWLEWNRKKAQGDPEYDSWFKVHEKKLAKLKAAAEEEKRVRDNPKKKIGARKKK